MRLIVAQTPTQRLADGFSEPLPVGVVRWPGQRLTVVVKATYRYQPGTSRQSLVISPQQIPMTSLCAKGVADLVAFKPQTDVVLLGHAYAPSPRERIEARLQFDEIDRSFSVVGSVNDRLALVDAAVRTINGHDLAPPVGPCGPFYNIVGAEGGGPVVLPNVEAPRLDDEERDFDWDDLADGGDLYRTGGVSFASAGQRCTQNCATGSLTLRGLCPGGETQIIDMP